MIDPILSIGGNIIIVSKIFNIGNKILSNRSAFGNCNNFVVHFIFFLFNGIGA